MREIRRDWSKFQRLKHGSAFRALQQLQYHVNEAFQRCLTRVDAHCEFSDGLSDDKKLFHPVMNPVGPFEVFLSPNRSRPKHEILLKEGVMEYKYFVRLDLSEYS